ncbi:MAG: NIPSNAP family protein [Pseudohongiellaceae bacterium]
MKKYLTLGAPLVATLALAWMSNTILAQGAVPPCGPADQLGADYSANVAANARCFELRMYTVDPAQVGTGDFNGGINELHQRFREDEAAMFERHGADVIGVWQDVTRPNTLIWMLSYRDTAHRAEVWQKFAADPEWAALRTKYNVPLSAPQVFYMSATDYSDMK